MKTLNEIKAIAEKGEWLVYAGNSPKVGDVVIHDGTGSREGWVGAVIAFKAESLANYRIIVKWYLSASGVTLRNPHHSGDIGVNQSYGHQWARGSLKVARVPQVSPWKQQLDKHIADLSKAVKAGGFLPLDRVGCAINSIETDFSTWHFPEPFVVIQKPKKKKKHASFIIWSPEGRTPPRKVHVSRERAEFVAAEMAERYEQDFYVCELVAKAVPSVKTTRTVTVKMESL